MATNTPNYNLKKPAESDYYDIADHNGNMDIIDTQMKTNADAIATKQATITGGASSITSTNLTTGRALVSDSSGKVAVSAITSTELGYLDNATGNIQTQLNGKQPNLTFDDTPTANSDNPVKSSGIKTALDGKQNTVTGGASTVTSSNLTTNRALVSTGSGKIAVSEITSTELGYLDNVTSNIQTQLNGKQATITGGASTIASTDLTASRALLSNSSGKVAVSDVTATELSYLDGVTSAIQTQIDGKQATVTGGASSIVSSNLTASRAIVSDANGKVAVSDVTSTELGYLDGVTSAIQTQLNSKAPTSHASSGTTYGVGNANNYGHVKLSDLPDLSKGVSSGTAVTPKALWDVISSLFTKSSTTISNSGWITFSGFKIVWKKQSITSYSGTITLPLSFSNESYVASITFEGGANQPNLYISSKNVSSVNFYGNYNSGTANLIAIGW